jgi:hypothetical protein
MKKFFIVILSLCAFNAGFAQLEKPNTVKFNFSALAFRTLSFQYERTLNEHMSVSLQLGRSLGRNFSNALLEQISQADTNVSSNGSYDKITAMRFNGGYQITPEFRYYFKGEGNKGFYLGAYLRHSKYKLTATEAHRDNASSPVKTFDFTGSWTSNNIGGIMGCQWHLGESFTIDWWILGLQFGRNKIEMQAEGDFSTTNKSAWIQDIRDNFPTKIANSLEASMTDTQANLAFAFGSPGFRSGLCLGYRF